MSPDLPAWNAALRFALEVGALIGLGAAGWDLGRGPARWLLALGLPLIAAVLWGAFRVPGDPGDAPVAIPGALRLLLEVVVLAGGAVGLGIAFGRWAGAGYAAALAVHYVNSLDRLRWLLAH